MLTALGWALLAAVEPLGIIAYIAMLGSQGGRRNTRGFIIGWMLCAALVSTITVQFEGHAQGGGSSFISSAGWLQVALGVALLASSSYDVVAVVASAPRPRKRSRVSSDRSGLP